MPRWPGSAPPPETDLDYRTKPASDAEERDIALRFIALETFSFFAIAVPFLLLRHSGFPSVLWVLLPISALYAVAAFFRWLFPMPWGSPALASWIAFVLAFIVFGLLLFGVPQSLVGFQLPSGWALVGLVINIAIAFVVF